MQASSVSKYAAPVLPDQQPSAAGEAPLADLPPGACGVIVDVTVGGALHNRLHDLGFLPGTAVKVVRRAPFGEPVLYEIRGYRISLRATEAARIIVRLNGQTG